MTGIERVNATLNRGRTDRPPFDFWAEDATLNRLFKHLGHNDLEKFLDDMRVDIRAFNAEEPAFKELGGGAYENMWGERFVYRETGWGPMREDTRGALYDASGIEEIMAFDWPDNDAMNYGLLLEKCLSARDKGLAVRYGFADIWQRPALVRGLENHLADMAGEPERVHYMSRVFTEFYLEEYRRAWEASRGNIDIFLIVSDVGSQRGPLISRDMFDEFVAPYLTEMTELIHGFGARAMFHSCGDIAAFIPSIIRCGADILNPVQPVGAGMTPAELKVYTDKIRFHGGVDVQWLIPNGTVEEVRLGVRRCAEEFGAGYFACPAHLFQPDTPAENIVAFYEAFEK